MGFKKRQIQDFSKHCRSCPLFHATLRERSQSKAEEKSTAPCSNFKIVIFRLFSVTEFSHVISHYFSRGCVVCVIRAKMVGSSFGSIEEPSIRDP